MADPDALTPDHDAFWAWWSSEGAAACEAGIAAGTLTDLAEVITERVHALSPDLVWELGPGATAQHQLVVSPEGNPDARATARRWLRAAPPATATWEYADARPASPDPASGGIQVGDATVDFGAIRIGATVVGHHVDVAVHHPLLRDLPEQARGTVVFISLDHTLGETECETWIGNVEAALEEPADALTLDGLRDLVAQVRTDALDADGEPTWVMLQGQVDGAPLMALAQVPLAPSWAPHLDAHLEVDVPFTDATAEGLPAPGALDDLRALEDHLTERLGGSGRLVAHETGRGRRTLHYYVDSARPTAGVVEAAVTGWTQGTVAVTHTPDPAWQGVRHLRT
ncbi:DUF695 domain-containing protein [Nocardioides sp.]|uniref:DUF695 domain-containing protein n=1 Tax=Nocardioides sp. TaxID=35761 RepID=UPI00271DC2DF|nr:DUF695 domain-containing protein [Nocardioides sp.]MDO9455162.1 DUF695 domain-containing protein [Nocardioides sp.]